MAKANIDNTANAAKFKPVQILKSKQFTLMEKDILKAILDPEGEYTVAEAREAIKIFMKREVI